MEKRIETRVAKGLVLGMEKGKMEKGKLEVARRLIAKGVMLKLAEITGVSTAVLIGKL